MSRARRKKSPVMLLDMSLDHGSAHMIRRGEIVREDRADPDAPNRTVAGTRRRDGLRVMWSRGLVTDAQWTAAERYRDDREKCEGAKAGADESGVRSTGARYEPPQAQLDALRRVRGATQAVGIILNPLLNWMLISGGTLDDYATCNRIRRDRAGEMAHKMLEKLADFYSEKIR